jgi:hypothetical protein
MFQVNTPGYEPCDLAKAGSQILDPQWKRVATAWGLQASTPIEAHPNCDRVCQRHRNLLGLGFKLKQGQLTRLPDPAILELECVACNRIRKKLKFASPEMQVAINEDHSTTAGIPGLKRTGSLTTRVLCIQLDTLLFLFSYQLPTICLLIFRGRDL